LVQVGAKIGLDEKSVKDRISEVFNRAQNTRQKRSPSGSKVASCTQEPIFKKNLSLAKKNI
jgi:hypothetical protein